MHAGLKCLVLATRQKGLELSVDRLIHDYALGEDEVPTSELLRIARDQGLKAKSAKMVWGDLEKLESALPVIIRLKSGAPVVLTGVRENNGVNEALVIDPTNPSAKVETLPQDKFIAAWSGETILLRREYSLTDEDQPFSLSWLIGGFLRQKTLLGLLVVVAFIIHAFAVLPAVFIMIVLDKVVNYQAFSTLYVISIGVVIAYIFNGVLNYLRQYIILFATSKVDVRLSSELFSKMLNLPLSYFQKQSVTSLSKTMQQTVSLRQVLTGKFFGAILDATSLFVFIPILFLYSPILCAVVFLFAALIAANVILSAKFQKNRLKDAAVADGRKQAVLMDSITGIETVKSLALEPTQKKQWEEAVGVHTAANMRLGRSNAISAQISASLQQLMTVAIIFVGVNMVFAGDLSAGVLIGVNMLAGRVTGPLVQLVSLTTDFEKIGVAIKSLASVMNTRGEAARRGIITDIIGGVDFRNVSYSYDTGTKALDNVSLHIKPREMVGIVGRAGSGKSTFARLIQGMVRPDEGTVTIDENDVRLIDLGHLRVNISAVNQGSGFFRGTIRENIIKPYPSATMSRLLWASKMVGLHGKVEELPDGYETNVEEAGSNLPQEILQKMALARAVIRNPRILILDEAITTFDVESEMELRAQIPAIRSGRTLIMITHRLSQVTNCDVIFVINEGKIVETGSHKELIAANGYYAELWRKETRLIMAEDMQETAELEQAS